MHEVRPPAQGPQHGARVVRVEGLAHRRPSRSHSVSAATTNRGPDRPQRARAAAADCRALNHASAMVMRAGSRPAVGSSASSMAGATTSNATPAEDRIAVRLGEELASAMSAMTVTSGLAV